MEKYMKTIVKSVLIFLFLAIASPSSFPQKNSIDQEIITAVQKSLDEVTDPDNKPFSESSKSTFLDAAKKELAKKSRKASAEQKEAILKRIPSFIKSRLGGEGTLTIYTMEKGIVKKEIVTGAAYK